MLLEFSTKMGYYNHSIEGAWCLFHSSDHYWKEFSNQYIDNHQGCWCLHPPLDDKLIAFVFNYCCLWKHLKTGNTNTAPLIQHINLLWVNGSCWKCCPRITSYDEILSLSCTKHMGTISLNSLWENLSKK